MGREIRRVPSNWEHPEINGKYIPLYKKEYNIAKKEWLDGLVAWEVRKNPDYDESHDWWEKNKDPPNRDNYVDYKGEEATWFQLYETISEGTPVTPPFATKKELVDYLVENGDFWDQVYYIDPKRRGWTPDSAIEMVESGIVPNRFKKYL